jgi:hypothetical protein
LRDKLILNKFDKNIGLKNVMIYSKQDTEFSVAKFLSTERRGTSISENTE